MEKVLLFAVMCIVTIRTFWNPQIVGSSVGWIIRVSSGPMPGARWPVALAACGVGAVLSWGLAYWEFRRTIAGKQGFDFVSGCLVGAGIVGTALITLGLIGLVLCAPIAWAIAILLLSTGNNFVRGAAVRSLARGEE